MKKLNNKGFSLVEILVAIAILAVLMSVAAQAYNTYKKQARQQAYDTMAKSATVAATNYLMENNKAKYITFDTLKELQYVDTLQDPRYKEKECSGIVINKVVQGETQKQLDVLFQKVKLCCKNYKYQYDYTGDDVKVTEIENCEYVEGDEIDGIYKLIYKPQGGTSCDPGIVMKKQREEWGPLCITTKENYVFKGWNTKKNGSGSTITEHTLVGDRDVNAYAIWNPIYTLTFNEDGGTICNPKTIDKENGEKWGTLCETSKTGYAFKGWTTKKDGKGSKITKNTYAEKNITAYAHWNPYYTLTFDSNEGNACNPNTITKEKDEEWGTLCKPTRTGYAFTEWNTKKDGTGTKITKSSKVSQNMTVYAIWNPKYTLTFDSNEGSACDPKTITEEKGKKWGTLCKTTRTGYTFGGWYNGTTKVTESTTVENTITVKAKWTAKKYTLTYDNNGGDGCTTKNGDYDSPWGDLCVPDKEGYTFTGWTKDGVAVTKNSICKSNITVIANWKINNYELTYSDDGDIKTCVSEKINKDYDVAWGTLCTPQKTGHTFAGWYKDDTKVTNKTKAKSDIKVTAQWTTNKYELTYDDNGGSGCSTESVKKSYNSKWGTLCKPSRTGYKFVSWNTRANGTGTTITENTKVSTSNIKVYAQWSANTCTLTYNNNGGSGCSGSISQSYSNAWGTLCKNSVREHYKFIGWNTKADGSGTNVTDTTSTTKVCDSTIYAQWTKKNYTLSFSGNGSTNCTPITKAYDTKWGTLCTPAAQTGYSFKGWYNGDTQVTADSKANATISVTSKWDANQYTLTYNNNGGTGCTSKKGYYASAWGTLCKPSKPNHEFAGWYDASGNKVTESTVCWGDKSVTARWNLSSKTTTVSGSGQSANSTIIITMAATNPNKNMPIVGTPSSGTANCVYSGDNIVCTITGVNSKSVVDTTDCQRAAKAKGLSSEDAAKVSYIKSTPYNSADAFEGSEGDGCYLHYNNSAFFTDNWSCKRAPTTIFKGETDHCPKKKNCGGSKCYTYGFVKSGNGYKCQCWIRLTDATYKTYYYATITATYYQYA